MDLSFFLARAWGLFIIIICLGLLLNRKYYAQTYKKLDHDDTALLLAGLIVLGIGVAQVLSYEVWQTNFKGLLTILGWAALIKGTLILLLPGYIEKLLKLSVKSNWLTVSFTIGFLLGVYLLFIGFTSY